MEEEQINPELIALGIEIQTELIALAMDEVEIMNFWDECYKAALKNKKNESSRNHIKNSS